MSEASRPGHQGRPGGPGADVAVVLVWFALLGLVAAVAWWQLAPGLVASRSDVGVVLDADQLERQVGVDGWYAALAVGGGLLSGLVLPWWRRRRPVLMVALVTAGGLLAGVVALQVGVALGPPDPESLLARGAVGDTAPLDLRLQASGLVWAWAACAAAGALVLLVLRGPEEGRRTRGGDPQAQAESVASDPAGR